MKYKSRLDKKTLYSSDFSGKNPIPREYLEKIVTASRYKHPQMSLLFLCGMFLGMRVSELVRLSTEKIFSDQFTFKSQKTGKRETRVVPRKFRVRLKELGFKKSELPPYPFISRVFNKEYIGQDWIAKMLKRYCRVVGMPEEHIKYISTHSLRKTYGVIFYEQAGRTHDALLDLCKTFHHSNTSVTLAYIGESNENLRGVLREFDI